MAGGREPLISMIYRTISALRRTVVTVVVFKGVTRELLIDPEFQNIAQEAIPSFADLHVEYDAAKASNEKGAV
jgi:hypothetical protein